MKFSLLFYTYIFSFFYIVFLSILYFSKSRLDNKENKIYKSLLITNFVGIIIQIVCEMASTINIYYLNLIVTKLLLLYFIVWIILLFSYVLEISNLNNKIFKGFNIAVLILSVIMVTILPYNFYSDGANGIYYTYGLDTKYTYLLSILYTTLISIISIIRHKEMTTKKSIPIYLLVFFFIISGLLQYLRPELTIIVQIETFICLIMYFTIENPDLKMIEQLNIARDQADKANRAKTDFLSSMSHEIRTPLNAIVGMSEDISTYEGELPDQIKEDANDIQVASQNLLEIVGNILDISKIESDKMEIAEVSYNFKEDAKALAKINSTRIGDKHIDFKVYISDDIPDFLLGDKIHIKEVLNNLLSNALKYTEEGIVAFNCKCINQDDTCNLIISVQDTGRGIKQEDIDKLFNKFERLGVEKNTTTEGTGLGLAITKKLVEMMGGKITVTSTFGQGSLFMVNIPQKIDRNTVMTQNSEVIVIGENNEVDYSTKKVLVVDDNPLNIKVATRALSNLNMQIDSVTSGQACIDKINAGETYDIILMDIMMPGMSGETTLAHLKANPNFNLPVIALTADAVSGAREKYLSAGFNDYIAKPFNRDQIKEKLDLIFKK